MKKIFAIMLSALLAVALISCTDAKKEETTNNNQNETVNTVYENVDLVAVADSLYDGIAEDNRPFVMSMPVEDAEMFSYFTFIPYEEGLEAVANEPMMSSIAHSIVLVKAPTAEKAQEVAAAMKENCDPRKWMCVEADIVEGVTNGNIAMLLMTTKEGGMADTILGNFKALDAEKIASLKSEVAIEDEVIEDEIFFADNGFTDVEDAEDIEAIKGELKSKREEYNFMTFDEYLDEIGESDVVDGEVMTEADNVVIEFDDVFVDDAPAAGFEEENVPAAMPEVEVNDKYKSEIVAPAPPVEIKFEEGPSDIVDELMDITPVINKEAETSDELFALADKLYEGIDPENMPMVGTMELTEENFEYSAFVPYKSSYLAVESMPMMGSQPHSVVIVKTESEEEAASLAAEMEANANPRKWICVQARSVKSASKGKMAILVMTSVEVMPTEGIDEAQAEEMSASQSEERAQLIIDNFLANA